MSGQTGIGMVSGKPTLRRRRARRTQTRATQRSAKFRLVAERRKAQNAAIASNALCAIPVGRCASPSQSTQTSSVPASAMVRAAARVRSAHQAAATYATTRSCSWKKPATKGASAENAAKRAKRRARATRSAIAAAMASSVAATPAMRAASGVAPKPIGDRGRTELNRDESFRGAVRGKNARVRERPGPAGGERAERVRHATRPSAIASVARLRPSCESEPSDALG